MADLTCGSGGSTGQEIITQINTNTSDIAALDVRVTALEGTNTGTNPGQNDATMSVPRVSCRTVNNTTITLDDVSFSIIPMFDSVVTERGGFEANLNGYSIGNASAPNQSSVVVSIGLNINFPSNETLELQLFINDQPYSDENFYIRGIGDNIPVAFFWQSELSLAEGDMLDVRGRNATGGTVDLDIVRTHFRLDGEL